MKAATIQVRVGPDGRVYIEGLSGDMLRIAAALNPRDASLAKRAKLLEQSGGSTTGRPDHWEHEDGHAEASE